MRRVALTVVLASLVVLAGCGGTGGTQTPTSTDEMTETTPTPTPTATPTPTPGSVDSVDYPDGASADGFSNPEQLAGSQRGLLNSSSFTLVYEAEVVSGAKEGDTAFLETTYSPDRSTTTIESTQGESTSNAEFWTGADETAFRSGNATQTKYSYYDRNTTFVTSFYRNYGLQVPGQFAGQFLTAFNYTAVDTEQRGGDTFVVYESTGVAEGEAGGNFVGADLRLVMRTDGLVTSLEGTVTEDTPDGEATREVSYEISGIGSTSVERPAWLDEKLPSVSAELVDGGSTIAITNEGPADLESGTLGIQADFSKQREFDGLAAGETIYITGTESDGEFNLTVHENKPGADAGDYDFSSADKVLVSIQSGSFRYVLRGDDESA